jgi:hypothetical protein
MVRGRYAMLVVYVFLNVDLVDIDYAKVTKRKERERGSSPSSNSVSEITNGQSHHHEDRQ